MKSPRPSVVIAAAVAVVFVVAGCGDPAQLETVPDSTLPSTMVGDTAPSGSSTVTSNPASTSPTATVPSTTMTTTTTTTTTTATPATTVPETTSPTSTVPATTVPEAQQPGWVPSDFQPAAFVLGYSGNWDGPPSPPAPTDPSHAPADGYYVATLRQPWADGDTHLRVTVQRLEYCTVIMGGCEYYDEGTNETNLDPTWSLDVDLALNSTSRVVVSGFSCWDDSDEQTKAATGTDLVDLFASFAADYDQAIRPLVVAGVDEQEIAESVAAAPVGGFVGEIEHCGDGDNGFAGPLRYVHGDAPVLLLQSVRHWVDGDTFQPMVPTDLVRLQGVEYRNGVPTFFFYAGFYS